MGFRDLKTFNLSLLAKQLWRIHCYPNSLLARSLKARYFPRTTVWESKLGSNASYAWRSLWSSRPTLELGVRWKVSNGKSIRIWHDAWLGGYGTSKLITPIRLLDANSTVDVFLDSDKNTWRRDLLSEVLFPIDVERVLQVPISSSPAADERVWAGSVDGKFRVRDVYNLALKLQNEDSGSNGHDPIWKRLWSLHLPPKAKSFLWRAAWDILPHGSNLAKKGVVEAILCKRCGSTETNAHVLWECDWSKAVWSQEKNIFYFPQNGMTFREWLGFMFLHKSQSEVELFGIVAWQIWCARNDFIFEKISLSPEMNYKKAADLLGEYRRAIEGSFKEKACRSQVKWVPPNSSFIKVNVDAAINEKDDRIGVGVVARNEDGNVVLAASKTLWPVVSVERAEIEAIQWSVELSKEHHFSKVVIEGDSQNIIKALQRLTTRGFHNQILIDNILEASSSFEHVIFDFCFREANSVAHRLAKWASSSVCSCVWLNGDPPWIVDLVLSDYPH